MLDGTGPTLYEVLGPKTIVGSHTVSVVGTGPILYEVSGPKTIVDSHTHGIAGRQRTYTV